MINCKAETGASNEGLKKHCKQKKGFPKYF